MKQTDLYQHGRTVVATLTAVLLGTPIAFAETPVESERKVKEASPYVEIVNEPPPQLIVDQPLPEGLKQGIVWIQYKVKNLRVIPVFGKGAKNVSPRVGHIHVHVDDYPFWWAEASNNNTIDIAGLPRGHHKVRIDLVNPNHEIYPGQTKIVHFYQSGQVDH